MTRYSQRTTRTDLKNYREITVLSLAVKSMPRIVAEQITVVEISEEQQGFRQNRSTTDTIFILRQIAEKSIECGKQAFMGFIDLIQASHRVRLRNIIELINKVPVLSGIKQGDSLRLILSWATS